MNNEVQVLNHARNHEHFAFSDVIIVGCIALLLFFVWKKIQSKE